MAIVYPLSEQGIERLNEEFYNGYDTEYWLHRIRTLEILLENSEEFLEKYGGEALEESSKESYEFTLKNEVFSTFYHSAETVFMLILACSTELPWIAMKHVWPSDIEELYEEELQSDVDRENIQAVFYPNISVPEEYEDDFESWITFIINYLQRMGGRYLDRDIYNEYKHGLRMSTGEGGITIAPEESPGGEVGEPVFSQGGLAHHYLKTEELEDTEDIDDDVYAIRRVISGFDYKLYLRMSEINYLLIKQLIQVRRDRRENDEGEIEVPLERFDYDIEDIFDYDHTQDWEFTFSLPTGEEFVAF